MDDGSQETRLPLYSAAMNHSSAATAAKQHGHILYYPDEWVQALGHRRWEAFHACGMFHVSAKAVQAQSRGGGSIDVSVGSSKNFTMSFTELIDFLTPSADGGGCHGVAADRRIQWPNGMLSCITWDKTRAYLVEDGGGAWGTQGIFF